MKYIDAERLRAEIKRQIRLEELNFAALGGGGQTFCINTLEWVIKRIDSLQQVQPDFPTTDEQIKEFLATHPKIGVPEKYKNPDWLFKKQEQPEVDLEKEIEKELRSHYNDDQDVYWWNYLKNSFRHFYELGRQAKPEVFDTVAFQKGVQEGRRLEREDALTIADIEKLHTFLYAVKNNKQGAFTFTRLSDEQYEEVLRRFNNAKEK